MRPALSRNKTKRRSNKRVSESDGSTATTTPSDADKTKVSKTESKQGWGVFIAASLSFIMLWLSFPPIGFSWLAWVALLPLIWIVHLTALPGRRPYWQLYGAGLLYWLGTFYFIPIPHPLLWFGWMAVSLYMAIYTPMFVGVSRVLVHRFKLPGLIAVPVIWTGIEWIRSNFATGMAMVCLSHSQYKLPIATQVADIFGAYTLTFAMTLFAAGVALATSGFGRNSKPPSRVYRLLGVTVSAGTLCAVLSYGQFRLNEPINYKSESSLAIGLIQSSNDVVFRGLTQDEWMTQLVEKYELTWSARQKWDDLDLVVWPESAFLPYVDIISDADATTTVDAVADTRTTVWSDAVGFPDFFPKPIPLLTGGGTRDPVNDKSYASAFLIGSDGQIKTRYYKNHLVMFGEYVPFSEWFPIIKKLSPLGGGTDAGEQFEIVSLEGVNIAPSICFETTIPHFIRRQVNSLTESGLEPDVMVNMTNDGWFYGTSCLDLHLACNVFRAIEMRKPHLICANTGLSAEIDSCGRLVQVGPRRETQVLRADIRPIERTSLYRSVGDLVPMMFGAFTLLIGLLGWLNRGNGRSVRPVKET